MPGDTDLWSQPTISRLKNLPDARALVRVGQVMVDHCCESFRHVPRHLTLDLGGTFHSVHGSQQLRLFGERYDEHGFQTIVVFDEAGRMIVAVLGQVSRESDRQIVRWLQRLIAAIHENRPRVENTLPADPITALRGAARLPHALA